MKNLYEASAPTLDLSGLVSRQRGKMLLTFVCVICATLAYLSLATRVFQSEAKLFVRLGSESATLDPTATTGQVVAIPESRESEVYAVHELVASRLIAEKVVDKFGPRAILRKDPDDPASTIGSKLSFLDDYNLNPLRVYSLRDKAINAFQQNLRVNTANKTSVVSTTYNSEDPKLAHDVLEAVLEAARDEHLRSHRTKGSQEFFEEQASLLKTSLTKLEDEYRELKNKTGFASLDLQRTNHLTLIGSLQGDLLRARAEHDSLEAEASLRRAQLKNMQPVIETERISGQPQNAAQTLREKLYDLEVKEQEFASKFTDVHPQLVLVREQIAEARRIAQNEQVPDEVKKAINESYQEAEASALDREALLAGVTAKIGSLEGTLTSVNSDIEKMNQSENSIVRLEREIDLARTNYRKYSEGLEQARVNDQLEEAKISGLNVLQAPTYSETPVSPRPIPTLALGLMAAVMSSFGVGLLANQLGRSRATAEATPTTIAGDSVVMPSRAASHLRRSEASSANPL